MRPWMAVLFGIAACTGTPEPPPKDAGPPTISSPVPVGAASSNASSKTLGSTPADAAASDASKLAPAGGAHGTILVSGSSIEITGPVSLRGNRTDKKRKYADKTGVMAEVKYYDDGAFKLRQADGTGLWKINRYTPEAGGTRFKVKQVVGNENVEHLVITPEDSGWRVDLK
ncbi:MAG TPA: hypothetical protein DFR83_16960, partial [Deltaproteobacteria bacterium]|nr:hypothetical protein [Deltaproteobacteria bacterium]